MTKENFQISKHAKKQIIERGLTEKLLMTILDNPDQTIQEDDEKMIFQSEVDVLVIRLSNEKIVKSDELKKGIILDYDQHDHVVKIEILDASKKGDALTRVEYELVPN